ncbi:ABC transporter permease [Clostridium manihotivorum]|uniref:Macrolide ABC transporter permease n=1 Tax=Clostridium manihotivorum TaxID=2320868 RepID=A0A3R5V9E6_9CLOT|nr:ABC transporter permease [Clostridium manihotivorum]QAA33171.1 macrolide ABC transporter permease [Clostridium manihotivorum]
MSGISSLLENFKMAIDSIVSNKMRSFLTMLGIIIGISSVIAIISLGQGGQNSITGEFEKLGASTVNVSTDTSKAAESDRITFEDIKQIKNKVETARYVAPSVSKTGVAISDTNNKKASIAGTNTDGFIIQNIEFLYGRAFNEREYAEGKNVVIIDEDSANDLFGYTDVTGKSIKIGSAKSPIKATIIGVTTSPFGTTFKNVGKNQRPGIFYVPATLLQSMYSNEFSIDRISIMASDKEALEETGNSAKNVLESRHNNRGKDIYTAQGALSQLEQINNVLGIFTTFIGAVAAISLLVGGIGVMNIMLVSVTERTREIGIRKAIGATTGKILLQFLTESVIISLIGGIIGLIIGIVGAYGIGSFANITPSLSITAIVGVIAFSSAVGIFFGIYPARKAAKLDPIEALRYE